MIVRSEVYLEDRVSLRTVKRRDHGFESMLIGGILIMIVGAGCFANHLSETNEPNYQGRSLSDWLKDFELRPLSDKQALAADAVRHMGSQTVPFLVERLSKRRWNHYEREMRKWQAQEINATNLAARPINPMHEAFAGLDALGPEATDALPALEKLLHDNEPDPSVLYVIARIGPTGMPILTKYLNSDVKILRLEANVCLDMVNSHSETLYPRIPVGPDAPSFNRRMVKFNLKVIQAAYLEYSNNHPELKAPTNIDSVPPPSIPMPVQ